MYKFFHTSVLSLLELPEVLLAEFQTIIDQLPNKESSTNEVETIANYKKRCETINYYLHQNFSQLEEKPNENFFANTSEINAYIDSLEEMVIRHQGKERFTSAGKDKFSIRLRKYFKRGGLQLHWSRIRLINLFRKLLKKPALPLHYWKHRIELRKVAKLVYLIGFLRMTKALLQQILDIQKEIFLELKDIDEKIEASILLGQPLPLEELRQNLLDIQENLDLQKSKIDSHFEEIKDKLTPVFNNICEKFDTIEFPAKKARTKIIYIKTQNLIQHYQKEMLGHSIQNYAIFEHWRLKYNQRFALIGTSSQFQESTLSIGNRIEEELYKKYGPIEELLEKTCKDLQEENNTGKLVKAILRKELLEKHIPQYLECVLGTDLSSPYDTLLNQCKLEWEEVPSLYYLPKKPNFENIRSGNQLRETNIDDILKGNFEEVFNQSLSKCKTEIMQEVQNSLAHSNEVAEIIDYSIEYYQTREQGEDDSAYTEFVNGIERAWKKANENLSFLKNLKENATTKLIEINNAFIQALLESTTLENLFDTQTDLVRKRRLRKAKDKVVNSVSFLTTKGEQGVQLLKKAVQYTKDKYSFVRQLLGLSTETDTIGSELSNYLSETEVAISKLPLLYQKLFATVPLTEDKFSIPREKVVHQLGLAYSNWTSEKFSPTCLIGETGSGSTTIINFFIKQYGHQYPVLRQSISNKIITESEFLEYFKVLFTGQNFETMEELIVQINQWRSKRILVLENIEKFFIRKSGGFENLRRLFRLISQTNTRIFWLCSCRIYAWQYLNYTQKISHFFAHLITLDTLDREQIIDLILKRHKASGFKLNFIPREDFNAKRNYLKLSEKEKQEYLKEDYFNRIYTFARNNLTLALIFWMRSVVRVEDNNFFLQFKQLNYSFLNAMNTAQITSLHALLIHENLSVKEHTEMFGWTEQESFEHLMVFNDDGILNKQNGQFHINPLIYRQLVEHLKSLNFVH